MSRRWRSWAISRTRSFSNDPVTEACFGDTMIPCPPEQALMPPVGITDGSGASVRVTAQGLLDTAARQLESTAVAP